MGAISRAMTINKKAGDFLDVFPDCDIITKSTVRSELLYKITKRDSLRIKFGVDPTASELHLGWMVPLLRLKKLQDMGHTIVLVIGDFTATIGDPSGKSGTRKQLSRDDVSAHAIELVHQFFHILDRSKTEVVFNSSWWSNVPAHEFINMCSSITVSQIMERNDFKSRFSEHSPIGLHEILYPILQARDSVFIDCDVEVGGSDQRFNCLLGRDIMSNEGMEPQTVVLTPLLVGLDGVKKMSQSLGNFISVRDESFDIFGKVMSINDDLMKNWWSLLQIPGEDEFIHDLESGVNPMILKKRLAFEIVKLICNEQSAISAQQDFEQKFVKKNWEELAPEVVFKSDELVEMSAASLLLSLGMVKSTSEARRLIISGAVEIGGTKITDPMLIINMVDLIGKHVRVGKKRFAKLVTE